MTCVATACFLGLFLLFSHLDFDVIVRVVDKVQFIKHCELSTVIIPIRRSCQRGGFMYNLDCLAGM